MGRTNWHPQVHSALCSDHFLESDYEHRSYWARKHLRPAAVPTVFKVRPPDAPPMPSMLTATNVECQPIIVRIIIKKIWTNSYCNNHIHNYS